MTFLTGNYIQTWQLGAPYAAERTFPEAVALCQSYGLGIMVKALDGRDWHASYAPEPDALGSVEQALEQQAFALSRGVHYAVWVNPLWGDPGFLEQEATLYADLGAAIGMLAFDTEPYAHFWGANRPVGAAAYLMQRFRDMAPNCVNVWQPDPRPARLAELRPEEWAPHMNVYSPQCYWPDFAETAQYTLTRAFEQFGWLEITEWAPTLPGSADAIDLGFALDFIRSQGAAGSVVWRMGAIGPAQLETLRPSGLPPDPCQQLRSDIQAIIHAKPYRAPARKTLASLLA